MNIEKNLYIGNQSYFIFLDINYWRLGLKDKYSIVQYHAKVKISYKCKGKNLLSIEKYLLKSEFICIWYGFLEIGA